MKKVIYRFHAYGMDFSPKFILRRGNYKVEIMGWARFLDQLLMSIQAPHAEDYFDDKTPVINKSWEEIFIDMDRLRDTNWQLYLKTSHCINEFDDLYLSPNKICEWLDELENFVCAKVVSTS